jgi:hypothetical protein
MNIRISSAPLQYDPKYFSDLGRAIQTLARNIPQAPAQVGYLMSNVTTTRALDADATSTAELADVLATLIEDLKLAGYIG